MTTEESTLNAIERIGKLDRDISELDKAIICTRDVISKVERNMHQRKEGLHDKVCCYCGIVFGEIYAPNVPAGVASHGICPACTPRAEMELQGYLARHNRT